MENKKINYNAKSYSEYKEELKLLAQKYYPELINDFQDSAIGTFFMDMAAGIGDNLSFHIDRQFQETQLAYMQNRKSLLSVARTNGLKVTGKRPSIIEAEWTCFLPPNNTNGLFEPDWSYAPIMRRGSQASGGGQKFELQSDINFAQQFNNAGVSDRTIIPIRNANGNIVGYNISKKCVMYSWESKRYKQYLSASDIKPFMEIVLPEQNVIKIESILIYDGRTHTEPTISDFFNDSDKRWYEVDNLTVDKIFGRNVTKSNTFKNKLLTELSDYGLNGVSNYGNTYCGSNGDGSKIYGYIPSIASWETVSQKFMTEYTDNNYCKITFGAGSDENVDNINLTDDYNKYLLNKMINNNYLGMLPKSDSTVYVYYTVGGGKSSNIGVGAMTSVNYLNVDINGANEAMRTQVKNSIKVTNTGASISGRDELTNEEIRYLIKFNNSSQDRCVTIDDYRNRLLTMPTEYGAPLKLGVVEKNNKILITMLGLTPEGNLSNYLSEATITNIMEYLSEYKMINDYIEIQPGKIVNLQFEIEASIVANGSKHDIAKEIALMVGEYMDINNNKMGDEIYISKLKTKLSGITGVKNLIGVKVFNVYGDSYSNHQIKQVVDEDTRTKNRVEIDLIESDGILYSDNDTMLEVKSPKVDIIVNIKEK